MSGSIQCTDCASLSTAVTAAADALLSGLVGRGVHVGAAVGSSVGTIVGLLVGFGVMSSSSLAACTRDGVIGTIPKFLTCACAAAIHRWVTSLISLVH